MPCISAQQLSQAPGFVPLEVFFNPRSVDSTSRSHTIESSYLAEHLTGATYRISEEDVETWLNLSKPGRLWQVPIRNKYGEQPSLNPSIGDDEGRAYYDFSLTGGRFEVAEPGGDLLSGVVGTPPTDHTPIGGRQTGSKSVLRLGVT